MHKGKTKTKTEKRGIKGRVKSGLVNVSDQRIADSMSTDIKRIVWMNFLIGTLRGLGFVIGTMIVLAMLVWVFQLLGGMPLIGEWLAEVVEFVQDKNSDLTDLSSTLPGNSGSHNSKVDVDVLTIPAELIDRLKDAAAK